MAPVYTWIPLGFTLVVLTLAIWLPRTWRPTQSKIATPSHTLFMNSLPKVSFLETIRPSALPQPRFEFMAVTSIKAPLTTIASDTISSPAATAICAWAPTVFVNYLLAGQTLVTNETLECVSSSACATSYGVSISTTALRPEWWNALPCANSVVPLACVIATDRACLPIAAPPTLLMGTSSEPTVTLQLSSAVTSPTVLNLTVTSDVLTEITIMATTLHRLQLYVNSTAAWGAGEIWPVEIGDYTTTVILANSSTSVLSLTFPTVPSSWRVEQVITREASLGTRALHLPALPDSLFIYPTDTNASLDVSATELLPRLELWEVSPQTELVSTETTLVLTIQFEFMLAAYYGASLLAVNGRKLYRRSTLDDKCPFAVEKCAPLVGHVVLTNITGGLEETTTPDSFRVANFTLLVAVLPAIALKTSPMAWPVAATGGTVETLITGEPLLFPEVQGAIASPAAIYYYMHSGPRPLLICAEATVASFLVGLTSEGSELGITSLPAATYTCVRLVETYHVFDALVLRGPQTTTLQQLTITWAPNNTHPQADVNAIASNFAWTSLTLPSVWEIVATPSQIGRNTFHPDTGAPITVELTVPRDHLLSPYATATRLGDTPTESVIQATEWLEQFGGRIQDWPQTQTSACDIPSTTYWSAEATSGVRAPASLPSGLDSQTTWANWKNVQMVLAPVEFWNPVTTATPVYTYNLSSECILHTFAIETALVTTVTVDESESRLPRVTPIALASTSLWILHSRQSLKTFLQHARETSSVSTADLQFIYALNQYAARLSPDISWALQGWGLQDTIDDEQELTINSFVLVAARPEDE
jgi:hypothetical protein